MKPRQQRMLAVGLVVVGVAVAAMFTLQALKDNMMFFVSVSDVVAGEYPQERNFRLGGLVLAGSVERAEDSLEMTFKVTDMRCEVPVSYTGVLPDLFREGQGVVAHGRLDDSGVFIADTILAKHDENYMAPEVADSLVDHVADQTASLGEFTTACGEEQ
ncbi:MAG: cytochrome c maturation protein CcmE [Gammaproteobacteria bacterium]|nr:cytochrome c maturation protein CcmE [Gammaproteobacteria bacterium]